MKDSPHLLTGVKAQGAGNDFLFVRCDDPSEVPTPEIIRRACSRRRGIGADGLVTYSVTHDDAIHARMFNCDGTEIRLCINASRCIPLVLDSSSLTLLVGSGRLTLERLDDHLVRTTLSLPRGTSIREQARRPAGRTHLVTGFGDPHLVVLCSEPPGLSFHAEALKLRREFDANVHMVSGEGLVHIRSFERGIEGEVEACGSGCIAAALTLRRSTPTEFRTRGGDLLEVEISHELLAAHVMGPAEVIGNFTFFVGTLAICR